MGKVISGFTMSLDGYIADSNDDVQKIMRWYFSGDTAYPVPESNMVFKTSRESAELLRERFEMIGAIVTGRRDFDVSRAWGGKNILGAPTFILTHNIPQEWAFEGSPFTFVTDGIESAVQKARNAAGDKNIAIGSSTTTQQCLNAGLLDEIEIDLVPILLGSGIRLFDHLGIAPIELENTRVIDTTGVTHLTFRIIK